MCVIGSLIIAALFFLKDKSQSGLGSAGVDPGYSAAARVICPQYRQGVNCIVAMTTLPKE